MYDYTRQEQGSQAPASVRMQDRAGDAGILDGEAAPIDRRLSDGPHNRWEGPMCMPMLLPTRDPDALFGAIVGQMGYNKDQLVSHRDQDVTNHSKPCMSAAVPDS